MITVEEKIKQIVSGMLENYLSTNKVDDGKVALEELEFLVNNKIDQRNIVNYTFTGTSAENIEHNLGRIPKGYIVLNQTQAAYISGDITTFTNKRVTLTSSTANNKVRLLFL